MSGLAARERLPARTPGACTSYRLFRFSVNAGGCFQASFRPRLDLIARHVVVSQITLEPGEVVKPHKAPVDAFFYVLEGAPSIEIEGETVTLKADALIPSAAGHMHAIRNEGKERVRFLVVKTPNPKAQPPAGETARGYPSGAGMAPPQAPRLGARGRHGSSSRRVRYRLRAGYRAGLASLSWSSSNPRSTKAALCCSSRDPYTRVTGPAAASLRSSASSCGRRRSSSR